MARRPTAPPIVKTRPCAICGKPIPLVWPATNRRVHAGACELAKLEQGLRTYRRFRYDFSDVMDATDPPVDELDGIHYPLEDNDTIRARLKTKERVDRFLHSDVCGDAEDRDAEIDDAIEGALADIIDEMAPRRHPSYAISW